MLVVIGVIIAAGVGVTVLVGTSIGEFSRDLPEYRARINAEVLPLLEWLRAKGMDIPSGGYMSHFEPGAAVQLVADLLNGFGRVLGNAFLIFLTVVFILFETASFPRKFSAVSDDPEHALEPVRRLPGEREALSRHQDRREPGDGGRDRALAGGARRGLPHALGVARVPAELRAEHRLLHRRGAGGAVRGGPARTGGGAVVGRRLSRGERGRRQHHRAALHGARPRPVGAGGVPVARVLGVGARPGRHVPLGTADDDDSRLRSTRARTRTGSRCCSVRRARRRRSWRRGRRSRTPVARTTRAMPPRERSCWYLCGLPALLRDDVSRVHGT